MFCQRPRSEALVLSVDPEPWRPLQELEEGDLLDPAFQRRLEEARLLLRQEIQKELKIKEAAERMRRALSGRRGAALLDGQLKASRRRLDRLHSQLQEVNAWAVAPDKEGPAPPVPAGG